MSRTIALANLDRANAARRKAAARRLAYVRRLAEQGWDRHAIADHLGISREWFGDWIRTTDPQLARQIPVRRVSGSRIAARHRLADIRWMAETGETLHSAAARLGIQPASLERRLLRHGETRLLAQLRNHHERTAAA